MCEWLVFLHERWVEVVALIEEGYLLKPHLWAAASPFFKLSAQHHSSSAPEPVSVYPYPAVPKTADHGCLFMIREELLKNIVEAVITSKGWSYSTLVLMM